MTIKAGHLWPAFIVMILFGFILVGIKQDFKNEYLVIGDWSQSHCAR